MNNKEEKRVWTIGDHWLPPQDPKTLILFCLVFILFGILISAIASFYFHFDFISVLFTYVITLFTAVEAISTYLQIYNNEKNTIIANITNELEKAYSPIFTIFNSKPKGEIENLELCIIDDVEKQIIDEIFLNYSFMFTSELCDIWSNEIKNKKIMVDGDGKKKIEIPIHFINKLSREYYRRLFYYRFRIFMKEIKD